MSKFVITGGKRLKGVLTPQGAKNEALQVICATLLTKEQVRITNVPEILDILKLIELLKGMGVKVEHPAHGEFVFQASHIDYSYFETEEFYLKSEDEMLEAFSACPEAVENTALIAERCNVTFEFGKTKLPHFEVPEGYDHFEWFSLLCL